MQRFNDETAASRRRNFASNCKIGQMFSDEAELALNEQLREDYISRYKWREVGQMLTDCQPGEKRNQQKLNSQTNLQNYQHQQQQQHTARTVPIRREMSNENANSSNWQQQQRYQHPADLNSELQSDVELDVDLGPEFSNFDNDDDNDDDDDDNENQRHQRRRPPSSSLGLNQSGCYSMLASFRLKSQLRARRPLSVLSAASSSARKSLSGTSASQSRIALGPRGAQHLVTNSKRRRQASELVACALDARRRAFALQREESLLGVPAVNQFTQTPDVLRWRLEAAQAAASHHQSPTSPTPPPQNQTRGLQSPNKQQSPSTSTKPPLAELDQNSYELRSSSPSSSESSSGSQFTQLVTSELAPIDPPLAAAAAQASSCRRNNGLLQMPVPRPRASRPIQEQRSTQSKQVIMQNKKQHSNSAQKHSADEIAPQSIGDNQLRRGALRRDSIRRLRLSKAREQNEQTDLEQRTSSMSSPNINIGSNNNKIKQSVEINSNKSSSKHKQTPDSAATNTWRESFFERRASSARELRSKKNNQQHQTNVKGENNDDLDELDSQLDDTRRRIKQMEQILHELKADSKRQEEGRQVTNNSRQEREIKIEYQQRPNRATSADRATKSSSSSAATAKQIPTTQQVAHEIDARPLQQQSLPKFEPSASDEFRKRVEKLRKLAHSGRNLSSASVSSPTLSTTTTNLLTETRMQTKQNNNSVATTASNKLQTTTKKPISTNWSGELLDQDQNRLSASSKIIMRPEVPKKFTSSDRYVTDLDTERVVEQKNKIPFVWRRANSSLASFLPREKQTDSSVTQQQPTQQTQIIRSQLHQQPAPTVVKLVVREKAAPEFNCARFEQAQTAPRQITRASPDQTITMASSSNQAATSSNEDSAIASSLSSASLSLRRPQPFSGTKQQQQQQQQELRAQSPTSKRPLASPTIATTTVRVSSPDAPQNQNKIHSFNDPKPVVEQRQLPAKRVHFNDQTLIRSYESLESLESNEQQQQLPAIQMLQHQTNQHPSGRSPDSAASADDTSGGRLSADSPAIYAVREELLLEPTTAAATSSSAFGFGSGQHLARPQVAQMPQLQQVFRQTQSHQPQQHHHHNISSSRQDANEFANNDDDEFDYALQLRQAATRRALVAGFSQTPQNCAASVAAASSPIASSAAASSSQLHQQQHPSQRYPFGVQQVAVVEPHRREMNALSDDGIGKPIRQLMQPSAAQFHQHLTLNQQQAYHHHQQQQHQHHNQHNQQQQQQQRQFFNVRQMPSQQTHHAANRRMTREELLAYQTEV